MTRADHKRLHTTVIPVTLTIIVVCLKYCFEKWTRILRAPFYKVDFSEWGLSNGGVLLPDFAVCHLSGLCFIAGTLVSVRVDGCEDNWEEEMQWMEDDQDQQSSYHRKYSPSLLACRDGGTAGDKKPPVKAEARRTLLHQMNQKEPLPLSQSFCGHFESLAKDTERSKDNWGLRSASHHLLAPPRSPDSPWQRFPSMLRKNASRQLSNELLDDSLSSTAAKLRESRSVERYNYPPGGVTRSISWDMGCLNTSLPDSGSFNLTALTRFKVM